MSVLKIIAENRGGRTVLTDVSFTAPLKVAKPFYRTDCTEVMLMTASAGLLEGDSRDIEITVRAGAALRFTEQSYTKIFRAGTVGAVQRVTLRVERGGTLFYTPQPVIPFGGSIFDSCTEVYLEPGCKFVLTDVLTCGRAAMGEEFEFTRYRSRTTVYLEKRLVFLDNQRLVPAETDLSGTGFFEGFSHAGFAYLYGTSPQLPEYPEIAVTKALEGTCVRFLGNNKEPLYSCLP